MSAEKIPYDNGDDEFNPKSASARDVISWFLSRAGERSNSDEAARYVAALLAVKDTETLSDEDNLVHARLRAIIMHSDISDDRWEDEDDIAGEIYEQLRASRDHSDELTDQRKALRYLLQLRGADVKSEDESRTVEDENTKRWNTLLRKIGSKALG